MARRPTIYVGVTALAAVLSFASTGVGALTMQECSAKYKAAQAAGTLNGKTWNQFRKEECGATAAAATPANPPANPPAKSPPAKSPQEKTQAAAPQAQTAAPQAKGNVVFPTAVSPSYSKESAGKARMHTCLDQYRANKATGGNGGLNWIQKGGGYYSECNKRLKG
jgi:hypothetical protein